MVLSAVLLVNSTTVEVVASILVIVEILVGAQALVAVFVVEVVFFRNHESQFDIPK